MNPPLTPQPSRPEGRGHGTWQETLWRVGAPMDLWVRDEGGGERRASPPWGYEALTESKEAGATLVQSGSPAEPEGGGQDTR